MTIILLGQLSMAVLPCFRMQQRLAFSRQPDSGKGQEMKSGGKKAKGKKGRGREELKPSPPTPTPLLIFPAHLSFPHPHYLTPGMGLLPGTG